VWIAPAQGVRGSINLCAHLGRVTVIQTCKAETIDQGSWYSATLRTSEILEV
jgi:hypothetical protein